MLNPGTVLQNRYQITRLLGQGGMGAVYLARDARLARNVAVKENLSGDKDQFQREALLLANLDHPNLPGVQDHFSEPNGAQYLVMDFIEGDDLQTRIQRQGALPEKEILGWFDQILDALAYLHTQGVIHRDIKPANIKITPQGKALLVDFGIAKVYKLGQPTMTMARAATQGYAAPEQYRGGTDQRSDIYSISATLYVLMTGCTPPDSTILEIGSAALVPPRTLNPAISAESEQAIMRGMMIQPQRRFQSANEMRRVLKIAQSSPIGIPTRHAPPTVAVNQRFVQRNTNPFLAALGIGALILVLIAAGLAVMTNKPLSTPKQTPVLERETRVVSPGLLQFNPPVTLDLPIFVTITITRPSSTLTIVPTITPTIIPTRSSTPSITRTITPTIVIARTPTPKERTNDLDEKEPPPEKPWYCSMIGC